METNARNAQTKHYLTPKSQFSRELECVFFLNSLNVQQEEEEEKEESGLQGVEWTGKKTAM